ncbi:MAG: hypothetical protein CMQ17_02790 [Gammaproteobacteria bacterium]|jgi:hypothetical protein|nr:hypothetical protein [Gammaproteobacteria bacterium]
MAWIQECLLLDKIVSRPLFLGEFFKQADHFYLSYSRFAVIFDRCMQRRIKVPLHRQSFFMARSLAGCRRGTRWQLSRHQYNIVIRECR